MIHAVMVISTQGKPRLLKFYNFQVDALFGPVMKPFRLSETNLVVNLMQMEERCANVNNEQGNVESPFMEGTRLVYKHLATLYFVFVFDSCENELAMLDIVQVFVETLDRCFKNVRELDIVFNFNKMHTILDEMILGGQVIETSYTANNEICRRDRAARETIKLDQPHTEVDFRAFQPLIFHSY